MTDNLTPADLAGYVHPVPVGAIIPAGTEHVVLTDDGSFSLRTYAHDSGQEVGYLPRWTAEPFSAPGPTPLADQVRALATVVARGSNLERLTLIVAELAEKVEGES